MTDNQKGLEGVGVPSMSTTRQSDQLMVAYMTP